MAHGLVNITAFTEIVTVIIEVSSNSTETGIS